MPSELLERLLINLGLGMGDLDGDAGGRGLVGGARPGPCLTGVVLLATRVSSTSFISTMLLTRRTTFFISSLTSLLSLLLFPSFSPGFSFSLIATPSISPLTQPASIRSVRGGLGGGIFFFSNCGEGNSCISMWKFRNFLSSTFALSLCCRANDFEMYNSCLSLLIVTSSCVGNWSNAISLPSCTSPRLCPSML